MIRVKTIKEAIVEILKTEDAPSKYKLAKELNLSTASHINNFLSGATKTTRVEVMAAIYSKYDVLIEAYENSFEYRKLQERQEDIKL